MNPFEMESKNVNENFMDWDMIYPKAYDKNKTSPWTKVRVILMNGTEFESQWFMHQFARHTDNLELKKDLAIVRAQEQAQQKRISCLKPINENMLETTISYEQLAIELTAILAQHETDINNKNALDFALLEDFDHLYRFANLLKMDYNIDADMLVGKFTEITVGRPTVAHYRFPADNIKRHMVSKNADLYSKCVASIITAAEQQTMNFYMNMAQMYKNNLGRKLFAQIGMVEEEHVSQYESLKDPNLTWLEQWVMHEYLECYLYYSMYEDESDEYIKNIWKEHFDMELAHLKLATKHLKEIEGTNIKKLFPVADFPQLLKFGENKQYVRKILESICLTSKGLDFTNITNLKNDDEFFEYQNVLNHDLKQVASHEVIEKFIKKYGKDYRFEISPHVNKNLRDRKHDNTEIGRNPKYC